MNKPVPISREYLLKRGTCCNNNCTNCPYKVEQGKRKDQIEFSNKMVAIGFGGVIGIVIFCLIVLILK